MWSGVVSGTQTAVLPAYRPQFQPVPLLNMTSSVDVRSSTPPSKHSQSPSSSSSQLSRDPSPGVHCPAADNMLKREESSDSGGVFLTPTSCSGAGLNLESDSDTVCRNSRSMSTDLPVTSLVDVGRTFGRLSDNGDVDYRAKEFATVLSRNGSSGDFQAVTSDAAEVSAHEQSASDLASGGVHARSNSCFGVLYHRSDEPFVTPTKTKKKTKKLRRNSQPGQTSCSSAKSMAVYGGNPKWIWRS